MMNETFETLSGAAFIKMEPQDITALSRDALLQLVFRCKAIVTAIATLTVTAETAAANNPQSVVAQILNMQSKEIVAALSSKKQEQQKEKESLSSTTSTTSLPLILSSTEPLPWRLNTRPKLPPGALLDIDQGPLYDLLTEWLMLEDICHLDSALCQRWRRAEFLALVSTKILLFNREEIRVLTDPYREEELFTHSALGAAALNWVLKRGIHLASLHPAHTHTNNRVEQQSILDAITSLALNGHLDKLEMISLYFYSYIEYADLEVVISKCYGSVRSIDIRECRLLTESAAAHFKRCTKLEAFASSGNETTAEMAEIFQACRKLRKVDLGGFGDRLTDEMLMSVADNCHLLEHVGIECCSVVSDVVIRRVAESCPLLQYVDLSYTNITDATVVALCNRCLLLKRSFLGGCHNLTDASVFTVADRLPGLTHIDVQFITTITSSVIENLASKCHSLSQSSRIIARS